MECAERVLLHLAALVYRKAWRKSGSLPHMTWTRTSSRRCSNRQEHPFAQLNVWLYPLTDVFLPPHQWQPADFRTTIGEKSKGLGDGVSRPGAAWEAGLQNMSLLKNMPNSPHLAEGVIGALSSASAAQPRIRSQFLQRAT